jgi:hypothetical protein
VNLRPLSAIVTTTHLFKKPDFFKVSVQFLGKAQVKRKKYDEKVRKRGWIRLVLDYGGPGALVWF